MTDCNGGSQLHYKAGDPIELCCNTKKDVGCIKVGLEIKGLKEIKEWEDAKNCVQYYQASKAASLGHAITLFLIITNALVLL